MRLNRSTVLAAALALVLAAAVSAQEAGTGQERAESGSSASPRQTGTGAPSFLLAQAQQQQPASPFEDIPLETPQAPSPFDDVEAEQQAQRRPGEDIIEEVAFRGTRRIPRDNLTARIFTKRGDLYDPQTLRRDFMVLWNTGYFDDLRLEVEDGESGKIVRFVVT